jgi:hypothetical protein
MICQRQVVIPPNCCERSGVSALVAEKSSTLSGNRPPNGFNRSGVLGSIISVQSVCQRSDSCYYNVPTVRI